MQYYNAAIAKGLSTYNISIISCVCVRACVRACVCVCVCAGNILFCRVAHLQ